MNQLIKAAAISTVLCSGISQATEYITYHGTDLSANPEYINHEGCSELVDKAIQLTPSSVGCLGSAFFQKKITSTDGFSAFFTFEISDRNNEFDPNISPAKSGADGIVFVLSRDINSFANSEEFSGSGIGYTGISNSVGIEFDTYNNKDTDYPEYESDSHLAIYTNGEPKLYTDGNPAFYKLKNRLFDGGIYYAWIDYDSTNHQLEVRISNDGVRPEPDPNLAPSIPKDIGGILTATIDLTSYVGNEFYVGFTSATGGYHERHAINQWLFSNRYHANGLEIDGVTYQSDTQAPTPPPISHLLTKISIGDSEDNVTVSDNIKYQVRINTLDWRDIEAATVFSANFGDYIEARAIDGVGNISEVSTLQLPTKENNENPISETPVNNNTSGGTTSSLWLFLLSAFMLARGRTRR